MLAVQTEYGWTGRGERAAVRACWRAMHEEESKTREAKRKAAAAEKKVQGTASTGQRAGRGRQDVQDSDED